MRRAAVVAAAAGILWAGMGTAARAQEPDPCTGGYVALCLSPSLNLLPIGPILEGGAIQIGPIERFCLLPGSCPA